MAENKNYSTHRILAQDRLVSNNTWETKLNNNDLIIGPSGSGKTRYYVKPNLLQCALELEEGKKCSLIVADAKGSLVKEVGPVLAAHGYEVINLDFIKLLNNSWGYNPLAYIEYDPELGKYSDQEILTIAACLCPVELKGDPFWDKSAQTYIAAAIAYVMEALPDEEHTLEAVIKLYRNIDRKTEDEHVTVGDRLFEDWAQEHPRSFACQKYWEATSGKAAEKTYASIKAILNGHLGPLSCDGVRHLFRLKKRIDFQRLGKEPTAVFLTISDTDRSMDKLTNLFYTQALNKLFASADRDYEDNRLPVPVRFILDDFATNVVIPNFDRISSNVRSREIYLSIILQSATQLYSIYNAYEGATIMNNCDSCLYLGGQDVATADIISKRAGRTMDSILHMPREEMWLMAGSDRAVRVHKYDLTAHPLYHELPEAGGAPAPLSNAPKTRFNLDQSACPNLEKRIKRALNLTWDDENLDEDTIPETVDWDEDAITEIQEYWATSRAMDAAEYEDDDEGNPLIDNRGVAVRRMSEEQKSSLRSRRKQLIDKAAQLELALSGRGAWVVPWVTDTAGRYSEQKLWALVDELAGSDELVGTDAKEAKLVTLERSFFYCALRLAANPPSWRAELTGVFDDVLQAARDAAAMDEPRGFVRWMDELYEAVAGESINDDFRDGYLGAAPDFVPDDIWDEDTITEIQDAIQDDIMRDRALDAAAYDGPLDDEGNPLVGKDEAPDFPEDTIWDADEIAEIQEYWATLKVMDAAEYDGPLDDAPLVDENEAWREQERKEWVRDLPAPVTFCQQYLQLRRLLFNADARKQLVQAVETALDVFLYKHQVSRLLDDEVYSHVYNQLFKIVETAQA